MNDTLQATRRRLEEIERELASLREKHAALKARWEQEKQLISRIRDIKEQIEQTKLEAADAERIGDYGRVAELRYGVLLELQKELDQLNERLAELQASGALLKEEVTAEDIAEIVAKWTGIPVQRMLESERTKLLKMEERLHQRIVDQEEAITTIANAIRRARAGLADPNRPIGSFIFLGTTGVGKTEMAKALAEFLFDDENAIVPIDMSEYMEKHSVSRLIGAPPGYVGYEEGGQLTEAVRRRPYSVVLFDEIEKAHNDVFNVLLQVLDDGRLTDNKGRTVNFRNTIIIMTSNLGTEVLLDRLHEVTEETREEIMREARVRIAEILRQRFRPEFLNRIDEIIVFKPLVRSEIRQIVLLQIRALQQRLEANGIHLELTDEVADWLGTIGFDPQFGARPLKRAIQRHITDPLSLRILAGDFTSGDRIVARLDERGLPEFYKENVASS
ncbi:Chaperone protein ClpB 1 [bacterium HR20]|nr:Chaperone protein ClpB 1 [bacterium HR20]